jgi:uncharacterized DUF497 family protein
VNYEWDIEKALANLRKHGIDFRDAISALEDPNRLEQIDAESDFSEERLRVIGMSHGVILFVVATVRGEDRCRIVSARKADRHEQDRYFAGDGEAW